MEWIVIPIQAMNSGISELPLRQFWGAKIIEGLPIEMGGFLVCSNNDDGIRLSILWRKIIRICRP